MFTKNNLNKSALIITIQSLDSQNKKFYLKYARPDV